LSLRKIVAALALLVGCAMASLTAPASAFAAESHTTTTVTPAACSTPSHPGKDSTVAITLCGSTVTAIGAQTWISFFGHLEFYGPHGHIANTADQQWFPGSFGTSPPISQSASPGNLWCVKLWARSGSGYVQLEVPNNCVAS